MELTLQVLDASGTLVLDLNGAASGYKGRTLPDAAREWEGDEVTSPWVDGSDMPQQRLKAAVKSVEVQVRGATWAEVETRYEALVAAIEQARWFLVIGREGVDRTWRAIGRASSQSPEPAHSVLNLLRTVTFSVLCQPTAVITGLDD
jgi:hypothetical protein